MPLLTRPEVESLCTKAARGAGLPWGLADEAGFAAGWLQARAINGASALAAYLAGPLGQAPQVGVGRWSGAAPLCPIATGAALADHRELPQGFTGHALLAIDGVAWPILLLPFLSSDSALSVACDKVKVVVDGNTVEGDCTALARLPMSSVILNRSASASGAVMPRPCPVEPVDLSVLERLAFETAVPPSAQSRADAGAAGSDND